MGKLGYPPAGFRIEAYSTIRGKYLRRDRMFDPLAEATRNYLKGACFTAAWVVAICVLALPLAAQHPGPVPPPPAGAITASAPAPQSSAGPREPTSTILHEPPARPGDTI